MKTPMEPVADGGLLDRRLFLKKSLLFSSAAALAPQTLSADSNQGRSAWMRTPGETFSNYGHPSAHERYNIRWIMANQDAPGNGVSWSPLHHLEGMITPNGLHFERHHNGVPQIDPQQHQLMIHGLVTKPLLYSIDNLLRYPLRSRICFIECGGNSNAGWRGKPIQSKAGYFHGMVSCSEWTGVPLSILLKEAGISNTATWMIAEGADAAMMNISLPVAKAMDDCLVALYQNGERIRPENGYPVRLVVPGWEGVTHVKWLRRLHVTDQPAMVRNETSKYTELLPSGKARQFTFVMQAKSLITNPSPGYKLDKPGLYQISGLAWSGQGKVIQVEVSADGGVTWAEAELQTPVLEKCFTRFRIPWQWNGRSAVIQSRVTDSSGYRQPTRKQLISQRGRQGYFHYNAIVSWAVSADGNVRHVYP